MVLRHCSVGTPPGRGAAKVKSKGAKPACHTAYIESGRHPSVKDCFTQARFSLPSVRNDGV